MKKHFKVENVIPLLSILSSITSCNAINATNVREYDIYPLLRLEQKDTRYSAALGLLNSTNYLLASLDTSVTIPKGDLIGKKSILYSKKTKSAIKFFTYEIDSRSSIVVGDFAVVPVNNQIKIIKLSDGTEQSISLGYFKSGVATSLSDRSFVYKDRVYIVLSDKIAVYNTSDLIQNPDVLPVWYLEKIFDSLSFDESNGELSLTYRKNNSSGESVSTNILRLDSSGNPKSDFRILDNVPTVYGYLAISSKMGDLYTLGGGKMQLRKYDVNNKLVWETPGFICPQGDTPVPNRLIRYNNTLLAIPLGDSCFSAWDTETGKMKWVFQAPNKFSFVNTPLLVNNVLYAANGYMWALDFDTGKILAISEKNSDTQGETGSPRYDSASNQIILWGKELQFYKPFK